MKDKSRLVFLFGALLLLLVFTAPIWRITLEAPQYPDGVTLYIYINKLGGDSPGTLQNVNILNHYVGMKMIEPDAIPELRYFQYVLLGMVFSGVVFAFLNNRKLWLSWIILLMILGALGIYDFYLWEYDYGHNLDPEAPIKVPGQAYQPPLIGSKMILNFNAISMPHWGSLYIFLSIVFTSVAWWLKGREHAS